MQVVLAALAVVAPLAMLPSSAGASTPPANDNFANATVITGASGSATGDTTGATHEGGEPGPTNARTIWYRWTAPATGTMTFSTCGSALDGIEMAAFTGDSIATMAASQTRFYYQCYPATNFYWQFHAVLGTTYSIQVYGSSPGRSTEGAVSLSWNLAVPPVNDDLANAVSISGASGQASGSNQGAFSEPGEPTAPSGDGHTIWFSWIAPGDGVVTFDTCGSTNTYTISAYTGSTIGTLAAVPTTSPFTCSYQQQVRFHAASGTAYKVQVDGTSRVLTSDQGAITLNWAFTGPPPANDDFANAVSITGASGTISGTNSNAFVEEGEPSNVPGYPANEYPATVWYSWTAPASGQVTFKACGGSAYPSVFVYTGAAVSSLTLVDPGRSTGSCSSQHDSFQFHATAGATYRIQVDNNAGPTTGTFNLTWQTVPAPANDDLANAQVISGAAGSVSGTNRGAFLEHGEAQGSDGHTVWFDWTAPFNGRATFDPQAVCNYDTDPEVSVFTGTTVGALALAQPSGSAQSCAGWTFEFGAVAGTTYHVRVDSAGSAYGGPFTLGWTLTPPPANDDFVNAQVLSTSSGVARGTTVGAFAEPNEPTGPYGSKHTVWYRWLAPRSGEVSLSLCGSAMFAQVYTGSSVGALSLVAQPGSCGDPRYKRFAVSGGVTYQIQVDTTQPDGPFALSWSYVEGNSDFDADLRSDLAVFRPSSSAWLVQDSSRGSLDQKYFGAPGDVPVPGDYDGTGHAEQAVYRPSSGLWFVFNSSTGTTTQTQFGNGTDDIPVPGDYDGDGRTDLAVYRPSLRAWFVRNSSDGTLTTRYWGASGDVPVPADYDGDGHTDFAVYRPSSGHWFVVNSADGSTNDATWGNGNDDVPVPGTYDNDNKADFAVYRPSTGAWFVLSSIDGSASQRYWGAAGDVPVPADYQAEGVTEMAVYRPSTGAWFVASSLYPGQGWASYWGKASEDVPLELPYAVRHQFFPTL